MRLVPATGAVEVAAAHAPFRRCLGGQGGAIAAGDVGLQLRDQAIDDAKVVGGGVNTLLLRRGAGGEGEHKGNR
ncbi:hypothetical protein GALL_483280 [mine drainage metagenome]|uniref:Uncharacterized protein n=1 Tax=mine drainage metagenome TaxID=410659 RepID=A0A1J5PEK7_9ZZZZ